MTSPFSLDEQETTINIYPKAISERAEVFTSTPNMIKRLMKLHEQYPDDVTVISGYGFIDASVPRGWIKIQPKRKCTLTDEQKRINAERLAKLRESKKEAKQT